MNLNPLKEKKMKGNEVNQKGLYATLAIDKDSNKNKKLGV